MKNVMVSMQITDLEKGFLKAVAENRDQISLAGLMKRASHLYAMFDPIFMTKIRALADAMKIPEYLVIQNIIIHRIAHDAAEREVWGEHSVSLDEFSFTEKGPITGADLFNMLKSREVQRLEAEKEIQLIQESQHAPLSPEDSEWLKKRMERRDSKPLQDRLRVYREKGYTAVIPKEEKARLLAEMKAKHKKQE